MNNKAIILILSVMLILLIFKIDTVKSQSCGSSCPSNFCKIECGELIYRDLPEGQAHYYNFTITGGVTEVNIKINSTLDTTDRITFNINVSSETPQPCPYDSCGMPLPPWYNVTCPAAGGRITFTKNLTIGTYYFIVNKTKGNKPYQISMNCTRLFAPGVFCCANRCYNSGICCLMKTPSEYWHPKGCFDFNTWVKPEKTMFTLGTKTPVILYIENKGSYTDSYDISYEIVNSPNPSLIKVDLTGVTPTNGLAYGEIKKLYPRIMTLYTDAIGDVKFNVTSQGDPTLYKTATLNIIESDFPLSLSEFGIFGLIGMIILAGIIYLIIRIKK